MYNPFVGRPLITSSDELYERDDQLRLLRKHFRNRQNVALFGPEGSGKTVLLNTFFNHEFRKEKALEKTLIYQGEFPSNLSGEETYGFFADCIRTSVEFLEVCGKTEEMDKILRSLDAVQFDSKQSRFKQYLNKIGTNYQYRMVIVLDNFENFTSSPDIKVAHHDLLCGMLNDKSLQLIVATNFDFNDTSLPEGTRNSKLLTRFENIHMSALSDDACQKLLDRVAEIEEADFRFSAQQVRTLRAISGGNPLLLHTAAKHAFDVLYEEEECFEASVRSRTLQELLPVFRHWCKVTPADQLELLATLTENQELGEEKNNVASALLERGLLEKSFTLARSGRRIPAEGYTYNSVLFRDFCGHREWLDAVLKDNPLLRKEEETPAVVFDPMALLGGKKEVPQVFIEKMTVNNGGIHDHSTKNEMTYHPTVIVDNGFTRLFDILDLDSDKMGRKLLEIFNSTPLALPAGDDMAVEAAADRITAMFIPAEIEAEALEERQQEQETLESRFNAIRGRIDPAGMVDDDLLNSLSTKCRLYLQIAFVVDEALSALNDFRLGDLSAQMVMYGKVLEQHLRDNLYQLFHDDAELGAIVVENKSNSKRRFRDMEMKKASIGNYASLMRNPSRRLAELCETNSISFEGQMPDQSWWAQLGTDVDKARGLRNFGDHAGTETSQNGLDKMRKLLFSEARILHRCGVGGQLSRTIWPVPSRTAK